MAQIKESVARYLQQLETADRQEPPEALKRTRAAERKIEKLKEEMQRSNSKVKCSPHRSSRYR